MNFLTIIRRIRFNNFFDWYKELLFAIYWRLNVEYNKKYVDDTIANIRANFEFIPKEIFKYRPELAHIITLP